MNRRVIYRVSDSKTGLHVRKNSSFGGCTWTKNLGTSWSKLSHIKVSLKEGVLGRLVREGHNLIVEEFEVDEVLGHVYNIRNLP